MWYNNNIMASFGLVPLIRDRLCFLPSEKGGRNGRTPHSEQPKREDCTGMENTQTMKTQGILRISQDVIATIASCAATEIDGVAGLSAYTANIRSFLSRNGVNKSVVVSLSDDVAVIDVHLNLYYGTKIPAVSEAVQHAVKEAVQNMTGITVSKVNVFIGDITFPLPQAAQ